MGKGSQGPGSRENPQNSELSSGSHSPWKQKRKGGGLNQLFSTTELQLQEASLECGDPGRSAGRTDTRARSQKGSSFAFASGNLGQGFHKVGHMGQ